MTASSLSALSRRHLLQGAMTLGAGSALGWPSAANAVTAGEGGQPVLHWKQGDVVTLKVTNNLPELTGMHWHGIILPNDMDGVPGLEFPGIRPGETFTYRFPVLQSGTYWYHSHMGYQEQKGLAGALVIEPEGEPLIKADRDYVVVLSDWMDGSPLLVQNRLKHSADTYNYNRRTVGTFFSDVAQDGLGATIGERATWAKMRMDPSGIAEPTGALYTCLINGKTAGENWTGLFRPGERVRLRFINASAMTYYDISIPGLAMDVVHVHGNDVDRVTVDQLRIGVAETYDVIVQPKEDRAYTLFVQDMESSGFTRGTLAPRPGMEAPIPPLLDAPMRTMADMGMPHMMPDQVGASHPGRTRIDGINGKMGGISPAEAARRAGNQPMVPLSATTRALEPSVEQNYVMQMATNRTDRPGDGLDELTGQRRILTYADLRSVRPGVDPRPPTREITLTLTGNMERFIWGFDGKKFSEVGPIDVQLGERFRLRFENSTMMAHPIHLHGMWMELENGHGTHNPYLHTISVVPGSSRCSRKARERPGPR